MKRGNPYTRFGGWVGFTARVAKPNGFADSAYNSYHSFTLFLKSFQNDIKIFHRFHSHRFNIYLCMHLGHVKVLAIA